MKKIVILMLVLISSLFLYASFVSGNPICSGTCGDANGDKKVDVNDAMKTMRVAAGLETVPLSVMNCLDVNGDGRAGSTPDGLYLAQYAAGIVRTLNCVMATPTPVVSTPTLSTSPTLSTTSGGGRIGYCGDRIVQDPLFGGSEECDPNGAFSPAGLEQCTRLTPGGPYDTDCCSPYQGSVCAKPASTAGQRSPDTACQCVFSGTSNDGSASTSATAPVAAPAVITPVATGASSPIVSTASPTISRRITPIAKASDVMNPPSFLPSGVSSIATMLVLFGLLVSLIFLFKRD